MSMIYETQQVGQVVPGVESHEYDYVRAFAAERSRDPTVINEMVTAYIEIAKMLGIKASEFVARVRQHGTKIDQDVFLAGYLNQVRYKNALIGITVGYRTPLPVLREIRT